MRINSDNTEPPEEIEALVKMVSSESVMGVLLFSWWSTVLLGGDTVVLAL